MGLRNVDEKHCVSLRRMSSISSDRNARHIYMRHLARSAAGFILVRVDCWDWLAHTWDGTPDQIYLVDACLPMLVHQATN